ncbi:MAG: hypothetical protein LBT00_02995 [Spirochaetaceae bacterium]|jgi:hypothetical protein|nr:hypothetical protein [Spirochaetaceae bacterium]
MKKIFSVVVLAIVTVGVLTSCATPSIQAQASRIETVSAPKPRASQGIPADPNPKSIPEWAPNVGEEWTDEQIMKSILHTQQFGLDWYAERRPNSIETRVFVGDEGTQYYRAVLFVIAYNNYMYKWTDNPSMVCRLIESINTTGDAIYYYVGITRPVRFGSKGLNRLTYVEPYLPLHYNQRTDEPLLFYKEVDDDGFGHIDGYARHYNFFGDDYNMRNDTDVTDSHVYFDGESFKYNDKAPEITDISFTYSK